MTSLKSRLILAASLWIALGMIGAGLVLSAIFKHHVTTQFYDELHVHPRDVSNYRGPSSVATARATGSGVRSAAS